MNINHEHQPSRRFRRSFGAAVAVVSLAAGVAACGDSEDNVVPSAAASNAVLKHQVQQYLDMQVARAEAGKLSQQVPAYLEVQQGRAEAARMEAAAHSDGHLAQHAAEIADKVAQREAASHSDGHLQDKANEASQKLDPSSRSRVKAV